MAVRDPYASLEEIQREPPMIAVTAYPGVGKSCFLMSIQKAVPRTLYISCDKRGFRAAVSNKKVLSFYERKNIPLPEANQIISVDCWDDFYDTLEKYVFDPAEDGELQYDAVCIDGATEVSDFLVDKFDVDADASGDTGKGYRSIKRHWRILHRNLNRSGIIVCWSVHMKDMTKKVDLRSKLEKATTAKREEETWIVPDIAGGGMWMFMRAMDGILNLQRVGEDEDTEYNVFTDNHGDVFGKARADYGDGIKIFDTTLGDMLSLGGYLPTGDED